MRGGRAGTPTPRCGQFLLHVRSIFLCTECRHLISMSKTLPFYPSLHFPTSLLLQGQKDFCICISTLQYVKQSMLQRSQAAIANKIKSPGFLWQPELGLVIYSCLREQLSGEGSNLKSVLIVDKTCTPGYSRQGQKNPRFECTTHED